MNRLHYGSPDQTHDSRPACGRSGLSASEVTDHLDSVTCLRCRGTLRFFLASPDPF